MAAGKYHLAVEAGATFQRTLRLKSGGVPYDLTGFTLRGQIRRTTDVSDAVLETLTLTVTDAANGVVLLVLSAAQTTALPVPPRGGAWVYDIEMEAGDGTVTRLLSGNVTVAPNVTRPS